MFIAKQIQSPETIFKACTELQAFLDAAYDVDDPKICMERAADLETYLAQSAKLVADSEYQLNSLLKSSIMEGLKTIGEDVMSATILKKYIEGATKDYIYLVTWSDRINKVITHQLDMARTIISSHKSEMENLRYSRG